MQRMNYQNRFLPWHKNWLFISFRIIVCYLVMACHGITKCIIKETRQRIFLLWMMPFWLASNIFHRLLRGCRLLGEANARIVWVIREPVQLAIWLQIEFKYLSKPFLNSLWNRHITYSWNLICIAQQITGLKFNLGCDFLGKNGLYIQQSLLQMPCSMKAWEYPQMF